MKSDILTLRISSVLRRRLEKRAADEGRSLSSATVRLIEAGLGLLSDRADGGTSTVLVREGSARASLPPLGGSFEGALVPELADFREIRAELSASLLKRTRPSAKRRR